VFLPLEDERQDDNCGGGDFCFLIRIAPNEERTQCGTTDNPAFHDTPLQ
jgi:hypothetical protein